MKNKGITLISLVVTIIILLILAGISIGMLSGDNSIIKQAGNAKTQTDIAEEKEILEQATVIAMGKSKYANVEKQYLDPELNKYSEIEGTEEVDEGIEVTFKSGRVYIVDADGNVEWQKPREYSDEVKAALTEGKYVTYNGETYIVLYDVNSGYGWIEIVSENPLDTVILGYGDLEMPTNEELANQGYGTTKFEKSRWSYNNAITTLHKKAQVYLTDLADRTRCVGSDPQNPDKDITELGYEVTDSDINSYIKTKGYNNKYKIADTNYTRGTDTSKVKKDLNQMNILDIAKFTETTNGTNYWLASRYIAMTNAYTYFGVRCVNNNGEFLTTNYLNQIGSGSSGIDSISNGFRPVIRLKDTIKITGGSGTSSSPYTIGL